MKKIYIIISIIVILIISIFIYLELTPEINKEDNLLVYDIASLKKTILEKNKIMLDQLFLIDSMIDDDDELQEFFYINDANSFEKTGIGFFLYKNNLLKYWSTNNIPLPSSATPFFFKDKILNLNNGWYSVECIIEDEYIIVGLFLIKKEYSYENDLLETGFNHLLDIPSNFDIIRDSAEFAIPVVLFSDKGDFFLLKNYTSSEDAINQLSLALKFLIIALFICLIIATYILFVQLRPSNKCLISLISIVLIIVGRFLMLKYGFPDFFDTLKLFSPELFAESQWLPSFGDYIINVILFLVVAIIYSNGVKFNVSIKKNIFVDIIISASLAIILIVVSRFITGLFHGLVWNSSISFSYDNIIALDIYSFIGLGLIVSILCGFIIIYNQIVSELKAIISLKIFAVCLILVFAISYLIQVYPYEWSISSLIFSFSFLFLWLTIAYLKIFNKKHSYYQLLILILLLSIIIAEHFSRLSKEKEEDMELVLAYNLATERDVGAEFFLAQINQELISDSTVIKASFNQDYEKIRSIINNKFLTNRYFNKYEIQITICLDIDSLLIAPDNISVKCFDFFDEIIDNYGVMLPETNFWFLDNHNGRISYFGNIELIENFDYTTRVFIELNSRIFSEGLGYPELLLEKKLTVKKMIKEYNHAKYHNGKLVTSKGNFKYPILFKHDNYNISSDNYFYYNDFKHLVYKPDDNNIIIISKEGSDYSKELVAFSYIYAILFLFFNILWLLFGLRKGIRIKSFTLKAKIQSSFISILILSLIITGSIAIYFIIKGYKEKQNEFLEDKVQSILVELEREFGHQNSFDVSEIQYLNYLLVRLSNVFYTDINLYDEDGTFVAFEHVWNAYDQIDKIQKAKYASGIDGNPDFKQSVKNWLKISDLDADVIATPGGAGAVSATLKNILNVGEIVLKPSLGWGPYKTMAEEFGIIHQDYVLFDGDQFNVDGLLKDVEEVLEKQGKAVVIINDPCHNPSGYTMTKDEWTKVLKGFDRLSKIGKIVLLHDIAYIDFNHQLDDWKDHFKRYDGLNENIMVVVAFSTSKTLTAYGVRVGAAVVFTKNQEERQKYVDAMIYSARSIWSTVNNSAMKLFSKIESTPALKKDYIDEKQYYIDLLKERADIFLAEAKEVSLPIYPFKEGFFITIKIDDDKIL